MPTDTIARALANRANQSAVISSKSVSAASASLLASDSNFIRTAGYAAAGDGGGALYKRVGSAPAHAGKFQSADGAWWELAETVVTPQMFGAAGDAVWNAATNAATGTDDRVAVQAAIDYFQLRGVGGVIEYSRLHRINTVAAMGAAMNAGLYQYGNNIRHVRNTAGLAGLVFDAAAGTANYRGLHLSGGIKVSLDVTANRCVDKAGYTPTATINPGDTSVTLSAGAGANFTAGDAIFIRTGQCLAATVAEPESEVNWADSIAGDTLTLRYPALGTYAQEYFKAGSAGLTDVAVTANLARFEVVNVQDRLLDGAHFDIDLIGYNPLQVLNIWGAVNVTLAPTCKISHGYLGAGSRDSRFVDCNARFLHLGRINGGYFLAPSTGCGEWTGALYGRSPRGSAYFHLHEGVKRCRFASVDAAVKGTALANGLIDILGRCGDLRFDSVYLDTGTATAAVITVGNNGDVQGNYCDGKVTFGTVIYRNGNTAGSAILINGANVSFDTDPVALGTHDRISNVTYTRTPTYGVRIGDTFFGPLLYDRQLILGNVGYDAEVEQVSNVTRVVFATGDRLLRVGYSGAMTAFVTGQVLSGLALFDVNRTERGTTTKNGTAIASVAGSEMGRPQVAQRQIIAEIDAASGTTNYTAGAMSVRARVRRTSRVS